MTVCKYNLVNAETEPCRKRGNVTCVQRADGFRNYNDVYEDSQVEHLFPWYDRRQEQIILLPGQKGVVVKGSLISFACGASY